MDKLEKSSHEFRKARARSLIQLGSLIQVSGLLETFEIKLGLDLQRDLEMKFPVAGLFKALVELNKLANSDSVFRPLWAEQGLQLLGELSRRNSNNIEN